MAIETRRRKTHWDMELRDIWPCARNDTGRSIHEWIVLTGLDEDEPVSLYDLIDAIEDCMEHIGQPIQRTE
jgi:hypothetical protein